MEACCELGVARRGLELRLFTPPRSVSACPSGTRSFTATGHLPEAFCDGQLVRGGPVHLHDTEAGPRAAWRRRRRRLPGVELPPHAVSYVEHLRLAVVLARAREKRRGKYWAWCVRATRELRGVKARPERARRRRPFNGGAATAPLNLCTPRQTEELI